MKVWYKSKTVWAGVVTAVIGLLTTIGVAGNLESEQNTIADLLTQLGVLVGGILGVYGRLTAKGRVTNRVGLPIPMILMCVMLSLMVGGCSLVNLSDSAYSESDEIVAEMRVAEIDDVEAAKLLRRTVSWFDSIIDDESESRLSPRFIQRAETQRSITRRKAELIESGNVPPGYAIHAISSTLKTFDLFQRAHTGSPSGM